MVDHRKRVDLVDARGKRAIRAILDVVQPAAGHHVVVVLLFGRQLATQTHDLAKLGKDRDSSPHKLEVAERHSLKVVRGKIPVPDIRIEYETRDGEKARLDLELATRHYRLRNLAMKALAGFSIFAW